MSFNTKDFPGQSFDSVEEYKEALRRRRIAEEAISQAKAGMTQVVATILPMPRDVLESRVVRLEAEIKTLHSHLRELMSLVQSGEQGTPNFEGVPIGLTLFGTTKGQTFTLEPMLGSYLCSDGRIYDSLSGAALGVSGNRRSGWVFWKNAEGKEVGEITGRFEEKEAHANLLYM